VSGKTSVKLVKYILNRDKKGKGQHKERGALR
jgi:hypothetical protein